MSTRSTRISVLTCCFDHLQFDLPKARSGVRTRDNLGILLHFRSRRSLSPPTSSAKVQQLATTDSFYGLHTPSNVHAELFIR